MKRIVEILFLVSSTSMYEVDGSNSLLVDQGNGVFHLRVIPETLIGDNKQR